jgi:hypothetical protein
MLMIFFFFYKLIAPKFTLNKIVCEIFFIIFLQFIRLIKPNP